ncbi:MAG: hypothetical protein ACI9HH_003534, partial [Pseudomonadota bacterium]
MRIGLSFLASPACGGGRIASSDAVRVGALSTTQLVERAP